MAYGYRILGRAEEGSKVHRRVEMLIEDEVYMVLGMIKGRSYSILSSREFQH